MKQSDLEALLFHDLGWSSARLTGERCYKIPCPLAPWRHQQGSDRRASMTVNFDTDGPSIATCYTCGFYRPFYELLFEVRTLSGGDVILAKAGLKAAQLEQNRSLNIDRKPRQAELVLHDYTDYYQDLLQNAWSREALDLLESKNVSYRTAKEIYQCAFIPKGYWDENMGFRAGTDVPKALASDCIAFPILSTIKGRVKCSGAMVRPMEGSYKYFMLYPFQPLMHFFGQQILPMVGDKPFALVEGPFDAMHLVQEGLPSAGMNGLHFSPRKALLIEKAKPIITLVMLDPDSPGQSAALKVTKHLDSKNIANKNIELERDPKYYSYQELRQRIPTLPKNHVITI